MNEVLNTVIKPSIAEPKLPRFNKELGFFIAGTLGLGLAAQPFELGNSPRGGADRWTIPVETRVGVGVDVGGISTRTMDSFVSLEGTLMTEAFRSHGAIGYGFFLHAPWVVFPGDFIFWVPLALTDCWPEPGVTAMRGGLFGWSRPFSLGGSATIQFPFLRRISFVYFPNAEMTIRRDGQRVTETHDKYLISVPVVSIAFYQMFSQSLGTLPMIDLAVDLNRVHDVEWTLGFSIHLSASTRWFP
jgi:hypothetical protein